MAKKKGRDQNRPSQGRVIDSHLHLDHLYRSKPERMGWMKEKSYVAVSWSFSTEARKAEDLEKYLENQSNLITVLRDQGLECYFLTGVHPRNIPPDLKIENVKGLLLPFLEHPLCLGIGEIGLESGTRREQEVLSAQLELMEEVRRLGKRFGIHTPRGNKVTATHTTLELLKGFPGSEEMAVIDHCTQETLKDVFEAGFSAGVTLSPIKTSLGQLSLIVKEYEGELDRIMCNTDSGEVFYEELYMFCRSKQFPEAMRHMLSHHNAARFFWDSNQKGI